MPAVYGPNAKNRLLCAMGDPEIVHSVPVLTSGAYTAGYFWRVRALGFLPLSRQKLRYLRTRMHVEFLVDVLYVIASGSV